MGLPLTVPVAFLFTLAPDCQQAEYNGYDIQNCTWTWGYEPKGEIAYALRTSDLSYYVMSPEQFDSEYPPRPSTTTLTTTTAATSTSTAPPPDGTPLNWFVGMQDYEWEDLVENDGWSREVMERARKRIRLMK